MTYQRCTVAFVAPDGAVLGSEPVELDPARLEDLAFVRWVEADQVNRRGPRGARGVLFVGNLSDAQCCIELQKDVT